MYPFGGVIPVLIIFASVLVLLPLLYAQNEATCTTGNGPTCVKNESSCITNYAELKYALFENGMGNIERLRYTFSPTNNPVPHRVWVFYFHNESSAWQDVLECPSTNRLDGCPERNESYHVLFWAYAPLLINVDITLLKFLSYNSILQYLGDGACVQLVIPPFCDSVDSDLVIDILKFATSYLQAYSISTTEDNRDYALHCDEKFEVEFAYDAFLSTSLVIICFGSAFFFTFLGFKLCSCEGYRVKKMIDTICSWFSRNRYDNVEGPTDANGLPNEQSSTSRGDPPNKNGNPYLRIHKDHVSVLLLINVATVFLLIIDIVSIAQDPHVVKEAMSYGYGTINFVLFVIACMSILVKVLLVAVYFIIYIIDVNKPCSERQIQHKNNEVLSYFLLATTTLTIASFLYILSRAFIVLLAFATYPQDVGLMILAIGSGVAAFLFVIWAIIHIIADSRDRQVKWCDIFIGLMPYWALLLMLGGFLLSYIYVILRYSIHPVDPVTSLASTLFPGAIAFFAQNQYSRQLRLIQSGETKARKEGLQSQEGPELQEESELLPILSDTLNTELVVEEQSTCMS